MPTFDPIVLNGIGIILIFAAGVMLAPGLLGLERLRRIEIALERQRNTAMYYFDDRLLASGKIEHRNWEFVIDRLSAQSRLWQAQFGVSIAHMGLRAAKPAR